MACFPLSDAPAFELSVWWGCGWAVASGFLGLPLSARNSAAGVWQGNQAPMLSMHHARGAAPSHKCGPGRGMRPQLPSACPPRIWPWQQEAGAGLEMLTSCLSWEDSPPSRSWGRGSPVFLTSPFWSGVSIMLSWRSKVQNQSHWSKSECQQGQHFLEALGRIHFLAILDTTYILRLLGPFSIFKACSVASSLLSDLLHLL